MSKRPALAEVIRDPVLFLATGFGSGLSPFAPGTAGSVVALAVYIVAVLWWPPWVFVVLLVLVLVTGSWLCGVAAQRMGRHDHSAIVWDEFAGYGITMLPVVLGLAPQSPVAAGVVGFFLFRLFDVLKPWPVSWADRRVPGGLGVMLDDVLAGLYCVPLMVLIALSGWLPAI